jgi:hypothetical protein
VAIDPLGRELVLTEPVRVPLSERRRREPDAWDLLLVWGADLEGPVPVPGEEAEPAWVVERPRVHLLPPGQAPDEAVILARLTQTQDGAEVDLSVRHRRTGCCRD